MLGTIDNIYFDTIDTQLVLLQNYLKNGLQLKNKYSNFW